MPEIFTGLAIGMLGVGLVLLCIYAIAWLIVGLDACAEMIRAYIRDEKAERVERRRLDL